MSGRDDGLNLIRQLVHCGGESRTWKRQCGPMHRNSRASRQLLPPHTVKSAFRLPPTVSRPELLEDGNDQRLRRLLYDLFVLSAHVDTIRSHVGGLVGLTPPQYSIVIVVAQSQENGGASVGAVAAHLHVSSAFVATEASKLVRKGFLMKRANPTDRRGVLLTLSREAEETIRSLAPYLRSINDRFFASLDRDQFLLCSETVTRLVEGAASAVEWLPVARRTLDLVYLPTSKTRPRYRRAMRRR
jgi:DNA-binding MarR family transcriptional regulator